MASSSFATALLWKNGGVSAASITGGTSKVSSPRNTIAVFFVPFWHSCWWVIVKIGVAPNPPSPGTPLPTASSHAGPLGSLLTPVARAPLLVPPLT